MGLLDKAQGSLPGNSTLEGWADFSEKINSLDKGIDFAVVLFRYFCNFLSIEKAAVFYRSNSSFSYNCLSSKGYDKTTGNRLRMDDSAFESDLFLQLRKDKVPCKSDEIPDFIKNYMSSREYGLLDEMYWLPFIVNDEIIAVYMITKWIDLEPMHWEKYFLELQNTYSYDISRSRKALVIAADNTVERKTNVDLKSLLEDKISDSHYIILIDLDPLIKQLELLKKDFTSLHYKKEILSVFKTMAGPNQEIIDLDNNRVLLILEKQRISDKTLFLHQLSSSLPLLFQDLSEAPSLVSTEYNYPVTDDEWNLLIKDLQ